VPAGRCDGRKPTAEYGGVQHRMLLMWSVQHPSDLRRSVAGIGVGKSHESLRPLIEPAGGHATDLLLLRGTALHRP